MPTLGLVANIYQEVNALPGWLETHLPYFDDVRVMHAGPGGMYSTDGTLELLQKWRIPVSFCSIDKGFGAVRTETLRLSPCDWVMLLDADERFFPLHREINCTGVGTPHAEVDRILQSYDLRDPKKVVDWDCIARLGDGLVVKHGDCYNQGQLLRRMLGSDPEIDAISTFRRHWHDIGMRRPTQHWYFEPDWQLRIVRNDSAIGFNPNTRMHEHIVGVKNTVRADLPRGPFFDHFHFTFKRMEPEQRAHDIAIFDAVHEGRRPPGIREFEEGRR
jgi:glycosyltransferase involved in cell wall biosynthesis